MGSQQWSWCSFPWHQGTVAAEEGSCGVTAVGNLATHGSQLHPLRHPAQSQPLPLQHYGLNHIVGFFVWLNELFCSGLWLSSCLPGGPQA